MADNDNPGAENRANLRGAYRKNLKSRWWLSVAAALTFIAAALFLLMDPESREGPSMVAEGSIQVTQLGDEGSFGFTPADGSVKMPVKVFKTESPATTFRFQDTLELFMNPPLSLEEITFIRVTTDSFEGDFVKFGGKTYRVYPTQKAETLMDEKLPFGE